MNGSRFSFTFLAAFLLSQSSLFAQESPDLIREIREPEVAPVVKSAFPTSVLARPFTMPQNVFEAKLQLKVGSHDDKDSFYSLNSLSLAYGITDDFEMGLSWGGMKVSSLAFENPQPSKSVSLNLGYFLFAAPWAAGMVSLSIPFHVDNEVVKTTSVSMPTSINIIRRKLAVLVLYDDMIVMNWRKQFETEFNFPVKLNYQVTDHLIVNASTHLGKLSTGGNHKHIGMETPLHVGALYAINNVFDVVASVGFSDVQKWQNTFAVTGGIAYRFGSIN